MVELERPSLWRYVKENIRTSFWAWDFGQRRGMLVSALVNVAVLSIATVAAFGGLSGWQIILHAEALKWVAAAGGLWFLALVVLVTPYRMWREERLGAILLRDRLSPQISVEFDQRPLFVTEVLATTPRRDMPSMAVDTESRWFHPRIVNTGSTIAKGVRVQLSDIERLEGEDYRPTSFINTQPLRWSQTAADEFAPKDIAPSAKQYFDLFSVDAEHAVFIKWPANWRGNQDIFRSPGTFRLSVLAIADQGSEVTKRFILTWTGKWDEARLELEQPRQGSGTY